MQFVSLPHLHLSTWPIFISSQLSLGILRDLLTVSFSVFSQSYYSYHQEILTVLYVGPASSTWLLVDWSVIAFCQSDCGGRRRLCPISRIRGKWHHTRGITNSRTWRSSTCLPYGRNEPTTASRNHTRRPNAHTKIPCDHSRSITDPLYTYQCRP